MTKKETNEQSSSRRTNTAAQSAPRASGQRPQNGQRPQSGQRPPQNGQRAQSGQRPPQNGQRRPQQGGANRRKKKKGVSPVLIVLIVALVLAIAVFAGVGVYAMRYSNYDKILPNVYVAGIDIGGMTKEEAKAAIEASLTDTTQQSVKVILPDQVLTFAPQQDTVLIDVDSAVEEAYAYGRTSSSPFAMARAIKAAQRRRQDLDIESALTVDTDYIRNLIDTTAADVATQVAESVVDTDLEAHIITVTIGSPGRSIDTEELYGLVYNAFVNQDYSDINFDYDMVYPAMVQLDTLYEQLTVEPKDATYNSDTEEIEAEAVGFTPDTPLDKANEALASAASGETLTFTFTETPPTVTAEELSGLLFRDTLSSKGTTYYSGNYGRTKNLELACKAIDGTVINPGEIFSFNDTVGERTAEKGYQEATVYVSGKSKAELGGGVCQVASTIYYAAMYADLDIVQRTEHQYIVTYVPGGLDATVYWGSLDFQFKNSTDYPIRIDAYLSGGRCWIDLIGTNINDKSVEIESVLVSSTPYQTITTTNAEEVQSGYTGYVYKITRYVYEGGVLVRTDTTEDLDNLSPRLGTSTYDKRDAYVLGGEEEPEESEEPSTPPSEDPSTPPSESPTTPPPASENPTTPPPASQEPATPPPATTDPEPVTPPVGEVDDPNMP